VPGPQHHPPPTTSPILEGRLDGRPGDRLYPHLSTIEVRGTRSARSPRLGPSGSRSLARIALKRRAMAISRTRERPRMHINLDLSAINAPSARLASTSANRQIASYTLGGLPSVIGIGGRAGLLAPAPCYSKFMVDPPQDGARLGRIARTQNAAHACL